MALKSNYNPAGTTLQVSSSRIKQRYEIPNMWAFHHHQKKQPTCPDHVPQEQFRFVFYDWKLVGKKKHVKV